MDSLIARITQKYTKPQIADVVTGDTVRVSQRVQEGGKTRIQIFEGVVISREGGTTINASITVRKIASGVGVEKKIPLHSPSIESIKVMKSSRVRRKKIFYLRNLVGKAARLKERQREILEGIGGVAVEEPSDKESTLEQEAKEPSNEKEIDVSAQEIVVQKTQEEENEEGAVASGQESAGHTQEREQENASEETTEEKAE